MLADRRIRIALIAAAGTIAALFLILVLMLLFGWSLLRGTIERKLGASLGRPVQVGAITRLNWNPFRPLLGIDGIRIGQPAWAGQGDMVQVRRAALQLPVLPLLAGQVRPVLVSIEGLRLALVRDAQGNANWKRDQKEVPSGAAPPDLGHVVVRDGIVSLDDAEGDRHFTAALAIDGQGVRMNGRGRLAGSPATLAISGPAMVGQKDWPFRADITSAIVSVHIEGRSATPLDLGHFSGHLVSQGRDLRDLDRLIEAGLPGTQPYRIAADIRHDRPAWFVTGLKGTIGRSDVAGELTVRKPGERTQLEGTLTSNGLDFDDLSSNEGLARAAARLKVTGPRLLPETRINLEKLRQTDGILHVDFRRLLSRTPSAFHSIRGTVTLDHGVLTVAPLLATLGPGRIEGSAVVRHQSGLPLLTVELRLSGSRLQGVLTDANQATGPLDGRIRLSGHGDTVREAIGRADGTIALVSRGGAIDRRVALMLGADVGRALLQQSGEATAMRCLIARFVTHGGIARAAPLVVDTAVARADGTGTLDLSTERFALAVTGRPKLAGALRLEGPIAIGGTIKAPKVTPPAQAKSAGSILKMIGKRIRGDDVPLASAADCAGLAAMALR